MKSNVRLLVREDLREWERVVYAEVLVPDVPNVYGDVWTKKAIVDAAASFLSNGFMIDIDHNNIDISDKVNVMEFFVARPGDQLFIEGSLVVGLKILDDGIWADILDNKINGFSYEATVEVYTGAVMITDDDMQRIGVTEPSIADGHTHTFLVVVDENNRPVSGGTDEVNGHYHTITTHTVTDGADGHSHRYNLVNGKDGK